MKRDSQQVMPLGFGALLSPPIREFLALGKERSIHDGQDAHCLSGIVFFHGHKLVGIGQRQIVAICVPLLHVFILLVEDSAQLCGVDLNRQVVIFALVTEQSLYEQFSSFAVVQAICVFKQLLGFLGNRGAKTETSDAESEMALLC